MKRLFIILTLAIFSIAAYATFPHEVLNYHLKFGFIKGGEASFVTRDTIIDNKKMVHVVLHGYTTGLADALFEVNNYYGSVIDTDNYLPVVATKNLHEQRYRFQNHVQFDHDNLSAVSKHSGNHKISEGVCDVVSLMYNIRYSGKLETLKPNDILSVPFWDTDNWYMLDIRYAGIEEIKTNDGKKKCYRLEPIIKRGKLFDPGNPINMWFTTDDKKTPVMMQLNFKVGAFKCELVS